MEATEFAGMTLVTWRRAPRDERPAVQDFEELAMPLLPSLYNLARWLTRDPAEAEDMVQETLLKALRGFGGFAAGTNFKAWIFRILRNTFLSSRSGLAAARTVALEDELEGAGVPESAIDRETPELSLLRLADREALEHALRQLPPPLLEVVLLCDVEEMKYREIAAVLEIPLGTVMSRIARARAALRTSLEAQGNPGKRAAV